MSVACDYGVKCQSPSIRREWIEIHDIYIVIARIPSPSIRREWIEML